MSSAPGLYAVSDLHVSYAANRELVDRIRPQHDRDWLIVAGDIGERAADIEQVLRTLVDRYAHVVWTPGNHELWTTSKSAAAARGVARYDGLVDFAAGLGISTPEDEYPIWPSADGPVTIAPLMTLYDYSFRAPGTANKAESLKAAYDAGIVCKDEFYLSPDPYDAIENWCADRVRRTERRLAHVDGPMVLVNHWPLVREPTRTMRYQVFPQWCGTERTADWHTRFDVRAVVYGHLHIPRTQIFDGVPHHEVSIGYPREWRRWGLRDELAVRIL